MEEKVDVKSVKENLKAVSKSDILFPKIALLGSDGARHDGRTPSQLRNIFLDVGIRSNSKGSSYLEMGSTKVICVVNGPKDMPRKNDYCHSGMITAEIQLVGGKMPEKDIKMVKEALEAVIILDRFPRCLLEISITVLEDDGSVLAACLTAAGLALLDGGFPVYGLPVGVCMLYDGDNFYMDPTLTEIKSLDMTEQQRNDKGGGIMTVGNMVTRDQICLLSLKGKIKPKEYITAIDTVTAACSDLYIAVRDKFSAIDNNSK